MIDKQSGDFVPLREDTQAARDAALPRERQGAVFRVGERVTVKDATFAVHSIGAKFLILRPVPGTDLSSDA